MGDTRRTAAANPLLEACLPRVLGLGLKLGLGLVLAAVAVGLARQEVWPQMLALEGARRAHQGLRVAAEGAREKWRLGPQE